MIEQYKILQARNADKLSEALNAHAKDGWVPYSSGQVQIRPDGGALCYSILLSRPMPPEECAHNFPDEEEREGWQGDPEDDRCKYCGTVGK